MDTEYQNLVFSNAFSLTHTSSDLYLSWWAHFRTQICWQGLRCCQTSNIWACVLRQLPPKRTQCGFLSSSVRRKKRKENILLFREISLVSKRSFMGQRTLQRKIVLFRKKEIFFFHSCLMGNTQKTRRIAHISVLNICIFKIRKYASFIHVYQSMNKKKFSDIIE